MKTIETLGEFRLLTQHLPDDTRVAPILIERDRPGMIRRCILQAEVMPPSLATGEYVVVALRPKELLPVFELAVSAHGECGDGI